MKAAAGQNQYQILKEKIIMHHEEAYKVDDLTKKEGDKKMQPNENNQIKIIRFLEDNIANDVFKL